VALDAAGDALVRSGPRRQALAALCVTEIVSYGVIYYAFPVMATQIASGTGWSLTAITAAYSAGNLCGALAGIPVGRLLHRYGPRPVMTVAGMLAAVSVAGIATAPSYPWFVTAWLIAGVASSGLFYPPAFAALTVWYGPRRVQALITLTLAAGFASTIFAPLASALDSRLGWRGSYLALAALLALIIVPVNAAGLRLPWTPEQDTPVRAGRPADRRVLTSPAFVMLSAAAALCAGSERWSSRRVRQKAEPPESANEPSEVSCTR